MALTEEIRCHVNRVEEYDWLTGEPQCNKGPCRTGINELGMRNVICVVPTVLPSQFSELEMLIFHGELEQVPQKWEAFRTRRHFLEEHMLSNDQLDHFGDNCAANSERDYAEV